MKTGKCLYYRLHKSRISPIKNLKLTDEDVKLTK
jgi:hypothetical protein